MFGSCHRLSNSYIPDQRQGADPIVQLSALILNSDQINQAVHGFRQHRTEANFDTDV